MLLRRDTYHAREQILEMIKSPDTEDRVKFRATKEWLERSLGKVQPVPASALKPDGGSAKDCESIVIILPGDSSEFGAAPPPALKPPAPQHNGRWKKGQSGNPRGRPKGTTRLAMLLRRGTYHALEQILEMIKSPDTEDRVKFRATKEWLERSLGKVQPVPASALKPDGGSAKDGESTVIILPSNSSEFGATPPPALKPSAPQLDHKPKAPEEIGVSDTPNSKPEPVLAEAAPLPASTPPPPSPSPEPHPAAALMHEPRIKSEDSHVAIMGPDGKMTYIPKKQPKQLTYAEVCEAAGATMKQRPRFR